jgi:hypothetical protein
MPGASLKDRRVAASNQAGLLPLATPLVDNVDYRRRVELLRRTQLLTSIGGLEVWQALDAGQPVTVVRSRPDIVARHFVDLYFSNIAAFEADLAEIERTPRRDSELALREVRRSEGIPTAIFDPLDGWILRDLVEYTVVERELAAAIALAIYVTYEGGPNMLTRDGNLVRRTLPPFENIWEREMPSLTGLEPELNEDARREELYTFYRMMSDDHDTPSLATLRAIAHPDPGPALVRALLIA